MEGEGIERRRSERGEMSGRGKKGEMNKSRMK